MMVVTLIFVIMLVLLSVTGWRYHFGGDGDGTLWCSDGLLGWCLVFAGVVEWFVERAVEVDAGRAAMVLGGLTGGRYG